MIYHNIDELSKDDFKWRRMAKKMTKCSIIADEILNIFYIKYISANPFQITGGYVRTSLKDIYKKHLIKYNYIEYNENYYVEEEDEYNYERDIENDIKYKKVLKELEKIEWFHRMIFKYIMIEGISMRQLERDTNIHFNIIQKSVANTKEYLKNKIE